MNIMVFNVPAESGGALSILNEFYKETMLHQDKRINWIFVLSIPNLEETDNIKVLRFPWVKKSWLHRLYFDNIVAPKLIKKYFINKVFSLQNVIIRHIKINQILYVHNSLPFVDYKFTFKKNRHLWIYQNIIAKSITKSIKLADKVIVQTNWMKQACINKTSINIEKIEVIAPQININVERFFEPNENSISTFLYPASEFIYKNHEVIVDACKKLKRQNSTNFTVIFTLKGDENDHILRLYKEVKEHQLPIEFVGNLTREQLFSLYTRTVLLFPSYVETYGLPMFEAKMHKGIVIASNCSFSHEILDDYENAYFFDAFNSSQLAEIMISLINNELKYITPSDLIQPRNNKDLVSVLI